MPARRTPARHGKCLKAGESAYPKRSRLARQPGERIMRPSMAMPKHKQPGGAEHGARPCGLPRRLLAIVYDTVLVLALLIVAGIVALPFTGTRVQAGRDVIFTLYLATVWFAYVGACWVRLGRTLGMRAWKVRIEATAPGGVNWRRALVRFAVSLASAACLGLGFLACLLRADRMCWHDRVSATRLVRSHLNNTHAPSDRAPQHQHDRQRQQQ